MSSSENSPVVESEGFATNWGNHAGGYVAGSTANYANPYPQYGVHNHQQASPQIFANTATPSWPQVRPLNPVVVPDFAIRIYDIKPIGRKLVDDGGRWIPNHRGGRNATFDGGTSKKYFVFDREEGKVKKHGNTLPTGYAHHRTASFYWSDAHGFSIFPGDISTQAGEEGYRWQQGLFAEAPVNITGYVTYNTSLHAGGSGNRLVHERNQGCDWVERLIPQRYRSNSAAFATDAAHWGSLKGELTMLTALLAYSVPPASVATVLENCILANRWIAPRPTERSRTHKRGMIVKIWVRDTDEERQRMWYYERSDAFFH